MNPNPNPNLSPTSMGFPNVEAIPGNTGGLVDRPHNKVAIPRPTNPITWTSSGRVSRACENCRDQKAKCSGHRPACHRCKDAGIRCSYGDRKREKMLKDLSDLTIEVQAMRKVLRELYPRLDDSLAQYVDQALGSELVRPTTSSISRLVTNDDPNHGAVDHTEEDFNRDEKVQALGFVGDHSEMVWLYRLKRFLDQDSLTLLGETANRSISSLNYFQDDTEFPSLENVDILGRPSQQLAKKLVDDFLEAVHPVFPIIRKSFFQAQCRSFYSNENVRPRSRWLAILNLVFAIAAKHSFLVDAQPLVARDDHLVYFARAWRLGFSNAALLGHPNLQQVQVEGLLAFYLLSTGQINRSWRITGVAIRSAVAMGLNLRSESESVSHVSKETRYRVWWALFMLDTLLCVMTGRPPSTGDTFCTTPFPIPYKEEDFEHEDVAQLITDNSHRTSFLKSLLSNENPTDTATTSGSSDAFSLASLSVPGSRKGSYSQQGQSMTESLAPNISLYFLYMVDLSSLLRDVIETLYAPRAMIQSWAEIETAISNFIKITDSWLSRLPAEFDFTKLDTDIHDQQFARQRTSLALRFYSTRLVITQPCLRRLAYPSVGVVSSEAGPLCDAMATLCVETAYKTLDQLPNEPDATLLYSHSPWWCMLHYVMQPTTVLLMEYFTRAQSGTPEAASISAEIQKAIRWLRVMSAYDVSSQRALQVCMDILSRHKLGFFDT
ncbi:hypothetical protein N7495_001567 [Penicillium taxi]|uniref:uncharacterized protein n=1 Tax=Penicillium taxi TaxID=168475 RepID=UPI002544D991|nr:uncharacterized protein N7495_001567 [Penicillium taxi]KAJ5908885.1 hypothetical protein N7495_001567 [Penicillium taxi]